jgi:hypothetical protein
MRARPGVIVGVLLAVVLAWHAALPASTAATGATRVPLEPVPYRFDVAEIALSARGRVLMSDGFDRAGNFWPAEVAGQTGEVPPYRVNMGFVDGSFVQDGQLKINESCSINPFENFAFDFSLPIDERGRYSFIGRELFGDLQFRAKIIRPRIQGPEKLKIGLVDDQIFLNAAVVSLEKGKVTLERQGGEPRTLTPFLETTFGEVDLTRFGDLDEVEMIFGVDAAGRASGVVKVRSGGSGEAFHLIADAPWARLDLNARYSAHVFVEDLARARIFSVYPENVTAEQLKSSGGTLRVKVFGIGFGEDARLEVTREDDGASAWSRPEDGKVLMFNMGLETKIALPRLEPGSYTVRIHTAGATASVGRGLRVME